MTLRLPTLSSNLRYHDPDNGRGAFIVSKRVRTHGTAIVDGVRYLTIAGVAEKFSRKKGWVYSISRRDKTFPAPLRLGESRIWKDHELDEWVEARSASYVPPAEARDARLRKP